MGRPAFLTGDRSWSHADVHEHGHAVAGFMAAAGVSPGDRVLLALSDRIELVWALLGAVRAGAVAVLVNPLLTEADHAFMVADTAPALVVCEEALTQRFDSEARTVAAAGLPRGGGIEVPAVDVTAEAAAYAQYTSGTTGPPKAALHRHSDPAGYHTAMGQGVLRLRPDDVVCSISKAYFAYGLGNSVFFPLFSGCAAVLEAGKPTAGRVGTIVARHRATVLFAVPSFYARLVAEGDAACFGSVRLAVSAGEALQPALYHRAQAWLGREVLDGLGSTEVGQTFISNLPGSSRPGTMGKVLPGYDAAICDDTGARVPAGEVGGLWVRGPTVMLGYLNRPNETAAVLVDGWCRTGDRASVDEDGYYRHHGRMDDLEVVGGINVSPLEIEAVLLEHPAVVEVAVASVPDETGASRLRCFAVLDAGTAWSPGLQAEILALPRSRLAAFKVPRSVTAVDSLPRTMTGKLRRHVLRAGWPAAPGGRAH
jgi:acyl-coenzyme A synthetase/AMP-(fatty) acid ligase